MTLGSPIPLIKFPGGKRQIATQLLALFPHRGSFVRYVEPFCGGAAMFFALRAEGWRGAALLSDLNPDVIALYHAVRDSADVLVDRFAELDAKYLAQSPVGREGFYYGVRDAHGVTPALADPVKGALRLLFLSSRCFNGLYRVNKAGKFNAPWGHDTTQPPQDLAARIRAAAVALQGVEIRHGDFAAVDYRRGDFVYADSPYSGTFSAYTKEGFSDADQERLASLATALPLDGVRIMLSNSDCPLIRKLYTDWDVTEIPARRSINRDGKGRGPVGEVVMRSWTATATSEAA